MANIDTRLNAIADNLATIVAVLDNHNARIAALEECNTGAGTASTKQSRCIAPKSVKPATTTSKKSASKGKGKQTSKKSDKQWKDVEFTATADPKGLSIKLDCNNKAAWKYVYKRICVGGKYGDGVISFADKKSYNSAVKAINTLKGIVPQTAIAEFIANGWA